MTTDDQQRQTTDEAKPGTSPELGELHGSRYIRHVRERDNYREELKNIADASPKKWGMTTDEFREEFQPWAQNRARHSIKASRTKPEVRRPQTMDEWFLSLPPLRQEILKEDKWRMAQAAFCAGVEEGKRDANNLVSQPRNKASACGDGSREGSA